MKTCSRPLIGLLTSLLLCQSVVLRGEDPPSKLAVPEADALTASRKLIAELFKGDYAKAKTAQQKTDLAKLLLGKAEQTKGDTAGQFVLLRTAKDIATQAGDVELTMTAIDSMAGTFDVDELTLKTDALSKLSAVDAAHAKAIGEQALETMDKALVVDQFELARRLVKVAQTEARLARDPELGRRALSISKELESVERAHEEVQKAMATLAKSALDQEANQAVGSYLCFVKGDWQKGLPMLALGKDSTLQKLAALELKGPTKPDEQLALADGWWALVEAAPASRKKKLVQQKACNWYNEAVSDLAGLQKEKAEKRISEVEKANQTAGNKGVGPQRPGQDPNRLVCLEARYGPYDGWVNVTRRVQDAFDKKETIHATTPWVKVKQTEQRKKSRLVIVYMRNGQRIEQALKHGKSWESQQYLAP